MATNLQRAGRSEQRLGAVLALVIAAFTGVPSSSPAVAGALDFTPVPMLQADWQDPATLPPRFHNHCSYDPWRGRYYCSNHCGIDYQFYYCSPASFGCCHPGRGYCGWDGELRCAP